MRTPHTCKIIRGVRFPSISARFRLSRRKLGGIEMVEMKVRLDVLMVLLITYGVGVASLTQSQRADNSRSLNEEGSG